MLWPLTIICNQIHLLKAVSDAMRRDFGDLLPDCHVVILLAAFKTETESIVLIGE